jgi:homoserine O-acetyltransferase
VSAVETLVAGDVVLESGITLPDTRIVFQTFGELNASRDNAVVYPTRYGGTHADNAYLIGDNRALNPARYYIVVPNMIGNGQSTSPSNTVPALAGDHFPLVTIADNVRLQHRLLVEELGVSTVALAVGWSMGAQQAYQWACLYPHMVERLAVICGAARTAPHTYVFLEGIKAALTADPDWGAPGRAVERGARALGRVWAGWAVSQAFYREHKYRELGYSSVEDFLVRYWEANYLPRDPADLVAMMRTWQAFDVSANQEWGGDYERAMRSISARAVIMPGETDLYFPPEDSQLEVGLLASARLAVIPSIWGHYAGGGKAAPDTAFIDAELRRLLDEPALQRAGRETLGRSASM